MAFDLTSLVECWEMDESSGNAVGVHASIALTDNNTVGAASGKINGARDFERDNSEYFSAASTAALQTGDIDFALTFWLNAESLTNFQALGGKGGVTDSEWLIDWRSTEFLNFFVTASFVGVTSAVTVTTGTWYFVVVWHDAGANTINISVNLETPVSQAHALGVTAGSGVFYIGEDLALGRYWDGLIDQVTFWKRILTSDERTALYNGGAGIAYPFSTGISGPLIGGRLTRSVLVGGRLAL